MELKLSAQEAQMKGAPQGPVYQVHTNDEFQHRVLIKDHSCSAIDSR